MSVTVEPATERQNLLIRLLDAVKQCQVRFGGRRELATEGDSRVSCLCAAWEAALSHGMRHTNKALSTLKQMTEITGLSKVASNIGIIENIHNMETEPVFWQYVKEHLSKHETQRYLLLRHVTTDAGRGRAWLRSTLNEHSLEKYMHMVLEDDAMIKTFYEDSAFLRDQERASMLPMMAAGLGSILFAINIDNPDLNAIKPAAGLDAILSSTPPSRGFPARPEEEPRPVIHSDLSPKNERRKERKKKKKIAHIVSFDDDDGTSSYCSTSPGSSVTSPLAKSFSVDLSSLPTVVSGSAPARTTHGFTQHPVHRVSTTTIAENSTVMPPATSNSGTVVSQPVTVSATVPADVTKVTSAGSNSVVATASRPTETSAGELATHQQDQVEVCHTELTTTQNGHAAVVSTLTDGQQQQANSLSPTEDSLADNEKTGSRAISGKAAMGELRCPSLMNGSVAEISPEEEKVDLARADKSEDTAVPLSRAVTSSSDSIGYPPAKTSGHIQGDNSVQIQTGHSVTNGEMGVDKEVLLDWNQARDKAPCDSDLASKLIKPGDIGEPLPKRMDSISEGYANLVMGTRDSPKEVLTKPVVTASSTVANTGVNDSVVVDLPQGDSWPCTSDAAKTESNASYHSSPNRSPAHRSQLGSPYRQASSPRPESIRGLDMADRYRLPRCDSSDSVPGSMSDSVRTTDSLRQRFGRWDSTDSADVRSITSNSSLGEPGPSPTLPHASLHHSGHMGGAVSLTPVSPEGRPLEGDFMMPIPATTASSEDSRSYDSIEVPSYTEDTENAAYALAVTQQGLLASSDLQKLGATSPEAVSSESLSPDELKQALIAMMLQKDETEALRRALETALEVEREVNTALRAEVDGLKQCATQMEERDTEKIKALSKENELLKHQLRKYVNAVQLLRTQGAKAEDIPGIHLEDVQPDMPPPRPHIDYSHEASEYEKKLIQVAEMHGELMEFNEVLHRQLSIKEATIQRLKQELTDLRGPLPEDFQMSDDSVSVTSDIDLAAFNRPLVNIWIPSAFLRGTGSDAFHVYQVYVRIRDEEWNIYRRYAEFHELHSKLRKKYPIVNTYEFPQKKTFGNRDPKFVEERRRKLQIYLRQVINLFLQTNPDFVANVSRTRLLQVAPFFGDTPVAEKKNKNKRKVSRGAPSARTGPPSSSPAPQQHYMGL